MNSMNPEFHDCECGHRWRHGQSGAHDCAPYYRQTIRHLRDAAAAPQVVADERVAFEAYLDSKNKHGLTNRDTFDAEYLAFMWKGWSERATIAAATVQAQELSDATIINAANKYGISPHAAMPFVRELIAAQSTTQEIREVANSVEFDGIKTDAVKAQEPIGYAPSYLTERMAAGDSAVMLTVTRKPLPGHGITVALYTAPVQPVAVPKAALADRVDAENYRAMLRVAERHGYSSISCAIKSAPRRPVLDGVKNYSIQAAPAAQGDAKEPTDKQLIAAFSNIFYSDYQGNPDGYELAIGRAAIAAKAAS